MVVVVMLVTVFASFVATSFQLVDQIPTRPNLENVFEDEQPRRRVGNSSPRSEIDETKLAGIDAAVKSALDKGEVPGAVVVVVHNDAVLYRKAYGSRAKKPAEEVMTLDTVFDLASLTKPLATATAIFKLVEAGKLKLTDKVSQHWPEFAANDKGTVTVEQCLLHTSGLIADNALADYKGDRAAAMKAIAGLKLQSPAGTKFQYSDVGFIVLGEIVERIAKMPLDEFTSKELFAPLGMADTGFKPTEKLKPRIAPTGLRNKEILRGEVHDPRAFAMGGVAGHAGLFGTADDLAIFTRMLLNEGKHNGKIILKPETVKLLIEKVEVTKGVFRSRGWDVDTAYSAPRGELFKKGEGYGHTGFTGTSIWIDPPSRTAIILLANRVHPDDKGNTTPLRKAIGTLVAGALKKE